MKRNQLWKGVIHYQCGVKLLGPPHYLSILYHMYILSFVQLFQLLPQNLVLFLLKRSEVWSNKRFLTFSGFVNIGFTFQDGNFLLYFT